jgi:HNH endonuclease
VSHEEKWVPGDRDGMIVRVPLALAPEVFCVHDTVLLSISSPRTEEMVPLTCRSTSLAAVAAPPRTTRVLALDGEMLGQFGSLTVPGHVWRTLQRLGSWVEPVLVNEWARLVRAYGERMGRMISIGEVEAALAWLDPARDTQLARLAAKRGPDMLDIDHCLPWSAWPCGDLWNLLPASSRVNQHLKRDRLPSASALAGARESIIAWWENAWLPDPALRARFERVRSAANIGGC